MLSQSRVLIFDLLQVCSCLVCSHEYHGHEGVREEEERVGGGKNLEVVDKLDELEEEEINLHPAHFASEEKCGNAKCIMCTTLDRFALHFLGFYFSNGDKL